MVLGLLTFKMRQMRVVFKLGGIFLAKNMSLMQEVMECPTMFQNLWKKMGWKPSDPGALYG